MKIPETPSTVEQLDLLRRLDDYAEGRATWLPESPALGANSKKACGQLHAQILKVVEKVFALMLDRTTARELDTFTMHDRNHGLKVAHLMWHILAPARRAILTPSEIGIMVISAYLHDAGMALSREQRAARLAPDSDLWELAEINTNTSQNLDRIRVALQDPKLQEPKRRRLDAELFQAEEALLALDTRDRHAKRERYIELINEITEYHDKDRVRIPDIEECLSFDGDSFKEKLIEICVSHNEDADVLVERDRENFDRPRFPRDYPVGSSTADLQLAAAALRLADILDFDRERTPPVLFHYLIPSSLRLGDEISALEWSKHLAISNWTIESEAIVFRGRSTSHIVHHAVIQFCKGIEEEILTTRSTFGSPDANLWPFALPTIVKADIHAEGYHYVPYRFELDENRIYELLMGGAIYNNPLVAIRELIQNAVDACSYRDALSRLHEPHVHPDTKNRIMIRYEEMATKGTYPLLTVTDSGTGMDARSIEQWFLKVGRSFYSSTDFARDRQEFRKTGLDFAPVSEFGIGFLSCFLLADRVEVETAMWEPVRGDTRKRHLEIDGPTRLIRIRETPNEGIKRFRGTRVSLHLARGGKKTAQGSRETPPTWKDVSTYLNETCLALPYRLTLEHVATSGSGKETIDPIQLHVEIAPQYSDMAIRIPLSEEESGLEGEIAIVPAAHCRAVRAKMLDESPVSLRPETADNTKSILLRGGFKIGEVSGIPHVDQGISGAIVSLKWKTNQNLRYSATNLARTSVADDTTISQNVFRSWLRFLIENRHQLPKGHLHGLNVFPTVRDLQSPSRNGWMDQYDLMTLYDFARGGWEDRLSAAYPNGNPLPRWEACEGSAYLPDRTFDIYAWVLNHILPRVSSNRLMDERCNFYALPPKPDWKNVLSSSRDFASNFTNWPALAIYTGDVSDRLFHSWSSTSVPLNANYSNRLANFRDEEMGQLAALFDKLLTDRFYHKSPSALTAERAALLNRAVLELRGLEISSIWGCAAIESFVKK